MEAIIRTNDSNAFYSLVNFLKSLHFEVETKEEKIKTKSQKQLIANKKTDEEIRAFYESIKVDLSNFKFDRDKANER